MNLNFTSLGTSLGISAIERGWVPDAMTRHAIRRLCRQRLFHEGGKKGDDAVASFAKSLREGPIAHEPAAANSQHYELPAEFFSIVLGPRRKYSCCYFASDDATLANAEEAALAITCERAELADGQRILELGCGWGSLSLWMAQQYPNSQITAVSNSAPQRVFIECEAQRLGLNNLTIVTADMNTFAPSERGFDRIVSVEMFEHMRNYQLLLARLGSWLAEDGRLFVHIFCHRQTAYPFETEGATNWMGRYFFTGGMMPSLGLIQQFDDDLHVTHRHVWNGEHYRRTAEAWLANLDANRQRVLPILVGVYGDRDAARWLQRWRMFFIAVAELFATAAGEEWFVAHYLLEPQAHPALRTAARI